MNTIDNFALNPSDITYLGKDLSRPECILANGDGTLLVADNRGIFTRHDPAGGCVLIGAKRGTPNGMALTRDGTLYVADIDAEEIYKIERNGEIRVVVDRYDGTTLGAANFVYFDASGRLWITISTKTKPRPAAIENPVADGEILLLDDKGLRRVASDLCFTNEVRMDNAGEYLYVAETAAGHVTRYKVDNDGSLHDREVFGPSPVFPGAKIDGITFDQAGNLWVTEITKNALVIIKPTGEAITVFSDPAGEYIHFPTSVTFAGHDRRTAYIGSLKMDRIAMFRVPIPGAPMYHW